MKALLLMVALVCLPLAACTDANGMTMDALSITRLAGDSLIVTQPNYRIHASVDSGVFEVTTSPAQTVVAGAALP